MKKRFDICVTMGDPAGIGPEVLAKALRSIGRLPGAVFFVVGDAACLFRHGFRQGPGVRLIDLKNVRPAYFKLGIPCQETARASLEYLRVAVSMIKSRAACGLVTGPVSKENLRRVGFSWPGHTEFLASAFGAAQVEMVFVAPRLKVVPVTRHVSLKEAIRSLSASKIERCGRLVFGLLKKNFRIRHPKVAVCGLNPHAGESGLFGKEEARIALAVKKLNRTFGRHFFGPLAPDTVFHRAAQGAFDLVLAMYHDQGLIPFKMVAFHDGVNLTAGLPFIRTSPVHGTAFDIAAKNEASFESMKAALLLAYRLTKNSFQ